MDGMRTANALVPGKVVKKNAPGMILFPLGSCMYR